VGRQRRDEIRRKALEMISKKPALTIVSEQEQE
jgi:hypothetical protein